MTMSLSLLDLETSRVTLCSAGHPPLILRRADGEVEELGEDIAGFPLGIMPDWRVQAARGRASSPATSWSSTPTA